MELVDAVKGLEVGFEDKDGKKVNSELGLMQTFGEQTLGLQHVKLVNSTVVWEHLGEGNLPLDLVVRVVESLLGMAEPDRENVETKLSRRLHLARAWPLRVWLPKYVVWFGD